MKIKSNLKKNNKPFEFTWSQVSVCTSGGVQIIDNMSGSIMSSRLLAIIGISGSGKSTLLNYLSGYSSRNLKGKGIVSAGDLIDLTASQLRRVCGYVLQHNILDENLTVEQSLKFSADFKLPSKSNKKNLIKEVIKILRLEKCKKSRVGGGLSRGISGGEQRRTLIGMELVENPAILFLDEPTTGLDTVNSENVCKILKEIALQNKVVIATLHQPSVSLLSLFDDILVLHNGKKVYQGQFSEIRDFFGIRGIVIPKFQNPVEYILNVLNMDSSSLLMMSSEIGSSFNNKYNEEIIQKMEDLMNGEGENESKMPIRQPSVYRSQNLYQSNELDKNEQIIKQRIRKGIVEMVYLSLKKESLKYFMDPSQFLVKVAISIIQAGLGAILYWDCGFDERGIQNREGALFYTLMFLTLGALTSAGSKFGMEKTVLKKELLQGQYTPFAYFFSSTTAYLLPSLVLHLLASSSIYFTSNLNQSSITKFFIFIAINTLGYITCESFGLLISSIFLDTRNSFVALSIFILPINMFAGFMLSLDKVPWILEVFKYVSFYRYVYQVMVINEFQGLNDCKPIELCRVPEDQMGFDNQVNFCYYVLISMTLIFRICAAIAFSIQYRNFSD